MCEKENTQWEYILGKVNQSLFRLIFRQRQPTQSHTKAKKHTTNKVAFCHLLLWSRRGELAPHPRHLPRVCAEGRMPERREKIGRP